MFKKFLRFVVVSALVATGAVAVAPVMAPAATAAASDGTVTVRVVQEVNANGLVDTTLLEPPLIGVKVHLTDSAGHSVTATTGDDGKAVFAPDGTLTGGQYRVDVDNPKPGTYEPGFAANGQSAAAAPVTATDLHKATNAKLSTNTEFVDVSNGQNAYVNTSFWYPPYYCQNNAAICDADLPWDAPPGATSPATERTLISAPYELNQQNMPLATKADTGAVYGIAYDRDHKRIFSAAYAKRGSAYGPGGPGAIYETDLTSTTYPLTGTTHQFATVPNAGADNHDLATHQDYGFFDHVGKESLGDIDVTDDNKYLYGVNMFDKTVFVYDLSDDSYKGSYPVPNPGCGADWRPMGTGSGMSGNFVGGVCSGQTDQDMSELSAHVYTFDPATGAFGAQVLDQPLTYGRGHGYNGTTCTGAVNGGPVGSWFSWISDYPAGPNEQMPGGCASGNWIAYPTPMLDDIEEETNGDLIIAFRDRFADQVGFDSQEKAANGTFGAFGEPGAGGDLLRGCQLTDGTYALDPDFDPATQTLAPGADCANNNDGSTNSNEPHTYREFYTGEWRTGFHDEAVYGGIALSHVEPNVISSGFDSTSEVWTQGISAVGRDGALPSGVAGLRTDQNTVDQFGKGGGMADLEVLCDEAPLQIGNRLWLDSDHDGVQDAGEPPVAGATVHLYDSTGALVGTTTTDADGGYLFDDSDVTGGLQKDTHYTVKVDNPADYATGGPLYQHVPTTPDAGGDTGLDSNGVVPAGGTYPEAVVDTGGAGQDDHSTDFGFVVQAPGVDIEKYDTVGGPTDGDADTAASAVAYQAGETRTIKFDVKNTGNVDLDHVNVTDSTITGGTVQGMTCTFPGDGFATAGTLTGSTWSVAWAATDASPPTTTWPAGGTFSCTATLTLSGGSAPHADSATVNATEAGTGQAVSDSDGYNAFTGDVQLVKYDGRGGFVPTQDANGIPQKPLVDGADRDANSAATAVDYVVPAGSSTTGPFPVRWAVTNTGTTWLGAISIADQTLDGPDLSGVSCDFRPVGGPATGTTWAGPWEPGSTFYCEGELTLDATGADATHGDEASVTSTVIHPAPNPAYDPSQPGSEPFTDQPELGAGNAPVLSDVHPADDDRYYAATLVPSATIQKGDGNAAGTTITNDADTMSDGQAYAPGETRDIVMNLANTGQTPLHDVTVTDALTSGDTTVQGLSCVFPGETTPTAGTLTGTTWSVPWQKTFDVAGGIAWQQGQTFACTATLTLGGSADPHVDTATVTTTMAPQGVPGDATNPPPANPDGPTAQNAYNAFTGDVQVIKYDGDKADPAIGAGPANWTPPAKPLADLSQDANDAAHAVNYTPGVAKPVTWVVTNTGATWLTAVDLTDTTDDGPDVGAWTCDLSGVGGPAGYSFGASGPWAGPLAPGASFFCTGDLTLPANTTHADTVDVTGTVVRPLFDANDHPLLDGNGVPRYATDGNGAPVASDQTVGDDDPFHAQTVAVTIVKGDGTGSTVVDDADTTEDGAVYAADGETRTIVTVATNPSPVALHDVVLTDVTGAGSAPTAMSCDFPDGTSANGAFDSASSTWTVTWAATVAPGTQTWQQGASIVCHASLSLDATSAPHRDVATVHAATPGGDDVTDANPYDAFSGGIQVIKYDGNGTDPKIGTSGAWTPPAKPLTDAGQDADDAAHAVHYALDPTGSGTGPQPVRWVVTNTGTTWLTDVVLTDVTDAGPSVDPSSISCTFPDGTTAGVVNGSVAWRNPAGVLFEPGASFFCEGTLALGADAQHADHVDAAAHIVAPDTDVDGNPTGTPLLGPGGLPVTAVDSATGGPWSVTDADAFFARSPAAAVKVLAATGVTPVSGLVSMLVLIFGGLALLLVRRRRTRIG